MGVLAPIFLSSSSSYTRMKPEFMISTRFSYRHMVGLKKKYNTMNDLFLAGTESDNKGLCSVQVSVQASNEMFWTNRAIIWFTWFPFCTYFHFINVEFKYSETKNNLHRSEMLHIFTKESVHKHKISSSADGGPHSMVCACETIRSAPHRHYRKFYGTWPDISPEFALIKMWIMTESVYKVCIF